MLNGFQVFDADAHALMTPGMWADLPDQYKLRRPRPIRVADSADMGRWNTGWLIEGGCIRIHLDRVPKRQTHPLWFFPSLAPRRKNAPLWLDSRCRLVVQIFPIPKRAFTIWNEWGSIFRFSSRQLCTRA